jgi:hypothetical protein
MKTFFLLCCLSCLFSCASKPLDPVCPNATEHIVLSPKDASLIQGNVSQFLSDAKIREEHDQESGKSIWRFSNMPPDSVYFLIGLREGDAIFQTNLGLQSSSLNLISDLSGIASGTTNCLYVRSMDNSLRVIHVDVGRK